MDRSSFNQQTFESLLQPINNNMHISKALHHALTHTHSLTHIHRQDTLPITPAQTWEFFAEKFFLCTVITISNAIFDLKSYSCQLETIA